MTAGHKHRVLTVRSLWVYRAFRIPIWKTTDVARVDRSPYPYGAIPVVTDDSIEFVYYLSILSVLHRWTGLAVRWKGEEDE